MNDSESEIIASKLAELNVLPNDYQPNLDSKWALLEATLDVKDNEKKRGVFWMRSAAALLLFGLFGFWMLSPYQVKTTVQNNTFSREALLPNKIQLTEGFQVELKVEKKLSNVKPNTKKAKSNKNRALNENQFIEALPVFSVTNFVIDSITSVVKSSPEIVFSPLNQIKTKKNRYVQLDFYPPVEPKPSDPPEQTFFVRNVRMSFSKYDHESRNAIPVNRHEALLKINF